MRIGATTQDENEDGYLNLDEFIEAFECMDEEETAGTLAVAPPLPLGHPLLEKLAQALEGSAGVAVELAAFSVFTAVALAQSGWPGWWGLAGICVYSYIAVYCVARVLMAYARKAVLGGVFFELHRLLGAACVLYGVVGWYKLVFLAGQPPISQATQRLDASVRGIAAISALWNYVSGILFLPHVNLQTPLLLRQVF